MNTQVPSSTSSLDEGLVGSMGFEINLSKSVKGNLDINCEIGVVLPTYCEAQNVKKLIDEIENLNLNISILVVDDSSPDGTSDIIRNFQRKYNNILLFVRPKKSGLGTAITDGFKIFLLLKNSPKYIVTMDADYSHNPKEIPKLIGLMRQDCDLVIGSRYCREGGTRDWSIMRLALSKIANLITELTIDAKIADYTSGMRCYSTNLVRDIINDLHSQTYEIQIETIRQANLRKFRIKEVPITFVNRKKGKSKLTFNEIKQFISYIFFKAILEYRR